MITVTTTQDRPSTNIPFFIETVPAVAASFLTLITNTTHMAAAPTFSLENAGLRHVSIATYANSAALQDFLDELDAAIPTFFEQRDAYNSTNGITVNRSVV